VAVASPQSLKASLGEVELNAMRQELRDHVRAEVREQLSEQPANLADVRAQLRNEFRTEVKRVVEEKDEQVADLQKQLDVALYKLDWLRTSIQSKGHPLVSAGSGGVGGSRPSSALASVGPAPTGPPLRK
jgi:flagellar biosynthesis GTPase FlhF